MSALRASAPKPPGAAGGGGPGVGARVARGRGFPLALALLVLLLASRAGAAGFADELVSFSPGERAGFGSDELPAIVFGPPQGSGDQQGSFDTLALGDGGSVVLAFRAAAICDGPGPDFTVFENAFYGGGTLLFAEVGIVAVSDDGVQFVEFPYDPITFAGLAGTHPVYSNASNGIDPFDPAVSGGDPFDLADLGLARATYVRITDPGAAIADPGNRVPPGNSAGFDLDAIAALHTCGGAPPTGSATPSATPTPTGAAAGSPTATRTSSATASSPTHTATPPPSPSATAASPSPTFAPEATPSNTRRRTPTATVDARTPTATPPLPGDANGDGRVDAADRGMTLHELFDGDGDAAVGIGGGLVHATAGADRNRDGLVTVADLLP